MNPPTLTLDATIVTLPHPSNRNAPARDLDERMVQRRTIGGKLRTTLLSYGYTYTLTFNAVSTSVYNALVDLWVTSVDAGRYPLFDYSDAWATANGVSVAIHLSVAAKAGSYAPDLVNFTLTLEEANPR